MNNFQVFRGSCPFRVYIQNKPDKYGIKIMTLCDGKSFYMVNAIPYTGRVEESADESVPAYYVRTLTEPIHGTNRNVTCDNWFSFIPLAESLLTDHKITIVGTLRKNKREIPQSFTSPRGKQVQSCQHAFRGPHTLLSYIPKKNKSVLLFSTMHKTAAIDQDTVRPEIIQNRRGCGHIGPALPHIF
jgi:hypothetical protein